MKQYNRLVIGVLIIWILSVGLIGLLFNSYGNPKQEKEYLVEINRIHQIFTVQENFSEIELSKYQWIKQIDYLEASIIQPEAKDLPVPEESDIPDVNDKSSIIELSQEAHDIERSMVARAFFEGKEIADYGINGIPKRSNYLILPLYAKLELLGYIRYAYIATEGAKENILFIAIQLLLSFIFLLMILLLLYIRRSILRPFHEISEMPYELSKGHFPKDIKETKNRYFGKFVWGLQLLKENLEEHKRKELQLERDKKLMILSISHDIKTPLSTIKLYTKALYENLYDQEEKKHETAKKIEEKADQIEKFVTEIIKTSSTELFEFDIRMGEFYLSKVIEEVKRAFEEKLELLKIEFLIYPYLDKLIVGDLEKLREVFDNILQNAIKYGDGRRLSIAFEEEDNCQLIRIFNTGKPIPTVNFHHMFESFWRGENAVEKQGNGLGLYICKQMMIKMEGDIFAEAEEEGMTFVLVLRKG